MMMKSYKKELEDEIESYIKNVFSKPTDREMSEIQREIIKSNFLAGVAYTLRGIHINCIDENRGAVNMVEFCKMAGVVEEMFSEISLIK